MGSQSVMVCRWENTQMKTGIWSFLVALPKYQVSCFPDSEWACSECGLQRLVPSEGRSQRAKAPETVKSPSRDWTQPWGRVSSDLGRAYALSGGMRGLGMLF